MHNSKAREHYLELVEQRARLWRIGYQADLLLERFLSPDSNPQAAVEYYRRRLEDNPV